jgi:putative oxidoreductase
MRAGGSVRFLDRLQPLALLALRLVLGIIMLAHGYSKLFGGFHKHAAFLSSVGLPWWLAYFSTSAEVGGGILLIVGLFTRCAALAVCIDLAVAIWKVHWKNGLLAEHGYEFPLAIATIAFALVFLGGGPISLDSVRKGGGGWGKQ